MGRDGETSREKGYMEDGEGRSSPFQDSLNGQCGGTDLAVAGWGQSKLSKCQHCASWLSPISVQVKTSPWHCCAPQLWGASMGHLQWGWRWEQSEHRGEGTWGRPCTSAHPR